MSGRCNRQSRPVRWPAGCSPLLLAVLLCHSLCSPAQAQLDPEDRTLQAMCQHGLAESAILVATARRAHTSDPSAQAKWTMRLMECHAWGALQTAATADEHWAACHASLDAFAAEQPENPRLPWLVWQAARCDLLQAQAALAAYLAVPAKQQLRDQALTKVREVMRETETLLEDIKIRQPLAAREGFRSESQAPAEELHKLALDVALLQCEALLVRARLYDSASPDRVAAATEVNSRADEVLARTADDWSGQEQVAVAQATAQLELGQRREAWLRLEQLARESSNPLVRIRAAVIAVESLASAEETSRAQALLEYLAAAGGGAELALARLQIGLAEIPSKPADSKQQALAELVAGAKRIGEQFGDYWRNRAEALLVGSISSGSVANSNVALELMLVEVRQLLASNDTPAAIKKLLQFRDNEAAAMHAETAIKLASQAAALLQREEQWEPAVAALAPVLQQFPTAGGAAEAHVLIVWSRTQQLRSDPNNEQLAAAYEAALTRQLTTWPDGAASDQAEQWLSGWLLAKQRRAELVQTLQTRGLAAKQAPTARGSITAWLEQLLQLTDSAERLAQLANMRSDASTAELESSRQSAQVACLVGEAFGNWPTAAEAAAIESQLTQLRSATADDPLDVQLLLAVDWLQAIRRNRINQLSNLAANWQPELLSPALRIGLAPALVEAIDETPVTANRSWAEGLQLPNSWSSELRASPRAYDQALGFRCVAWTENPTVGLDGISGLTQQDPRNGQLQLQLARALAASGANRIEDSTRIAKQLIASSPPASELNLSARWLMLKNEILRGESAGARQAAQLVIATQPQLSEVWQTRFETIAK